MLKRDSGLTLTEVLAGLVLISILVTLTTMILVHTFSSDKTAAKNVSLRQDTNTMISQARKSYHSGDEVICFDQQAKRISIVEAKTSITNSNGEIDYSGKTPCIRNFDKKIPIKLKITTADPSGKEIAVETTLVKGGQTLLTFGSEDFCEIEDDYWNEENAEKGDTLPCHAKGDFYWNGTSDKVDGSCTEHIIEGSLRIKEEVPAKLKNTIVHIKKNFYATRSQAHFENIELYIDGNASFIDQPYFEKHNKVEIGGNFCALGGSDLKLFDGSTMLVKKNMLLSGEMQIDKGGVLKVAGNLISTNKEPQLLSTGSLIVGGDTHFHKMRNFQTPQKFCIRGKLYEEGKEVKKENTGTCQDSDYPPSPF